MDHQVLCFGDSNTYGYDPRSYMGERYPESVRWTALLNATRWTVTNEGENGRRIPQLEQEAKVLSQAVRRAEAEIVVVMLGSNDLLQQPTPSAEICTERMERFLTAFLKEKPSSCEVLLIAPPPMELGAGVRDPKALDESRRLP
ncbi:MAG: lysophospholipase, partial [Oscillospiraceae bacterium]|nr:lysophospholipase [Oscillospiraceae bacterium]